MKLNNLQVVKSDGTAYIPTHNRAVYRTNPLFVTKEEDGKFRLHECTFRADLEPEVNDRFPIRVALYVHGEPISTEIKKGDTVLEITVKGHTVESNDPYFDRPEIMTMMFHAIVGQKAGEYEIVVPYAII